MTVARNWYSRTVRLYPSALVGLMVSDSRHGAENVSTLVGNYLHSLKTAIVQPDIVRGYAFQKKYYLLEALLEGLGISLS